jgi:hypothetical protein
LTRFTMERPYEPLEVDLWSEEDGGSVYQTTELSRSAQKKAVGLLERIDESTTEDESVERACAYLDFRLRPLGGGTKKPSTILLKKWRADKVAPARVGDLVAEVLNSDRPT